MKVPMRLMGFCCLLLISTSNAAQAADPGDTASIESTLAAVYESISGEAGEARDWARFLNLFADQATLSFLTQTDSGVWQRVVMTPESYIERAGSNLERDGFFEIETNSVIERFGHIAHVFSTYESRRSASDREPFARGINSFQLMFDGERWYVVSIYWQAESEEHRIPGRYE